jgi:hypothetical protein
MNVNTNTFQAGLGCDLDIGTTQKGTFQDSAASLFNSLPPDMNFNQFCKLTKQFLKDRAQTQ